MDDLIKRSDAIKVLHDCWWDTLEYAEQKMKDIPKVEAGPKHGKWIEHHEPYDWMGYTTWSCSECDYEVGYEKDVRHRTKCCPNCGAEME